MIGLPASARVIQLVQTTRIERRARQQNHGQCELADDENLAKPLMAATSRHAA